MTATIVDVVVIGAGPVGENVADRAVLGGLSVAIVERELVGGECSYWACMPTKALLRSTAALRAVRRLPSAREAVTGGLDTTAVLNRRDDFASHWKDDGQVSWLQQAGITLYRGQGRISGPRTVEVTDNDTDATTDSGADAGTVTLTARHAVVIASRSAAVHECYCGEPDNLGVLQLTPDELHAALIAYHVAGWTVATHAIGDRAIDHVLDAIAEAQRRHPREVRHRIEHFAIASDEQVRRCADLGVIPVPQGVFISDFGDGILEAIGPKRSAGTYRMRSLLDAGMVVPGSTDSPVSDANPLVSIHDLVNRVTGGGQDFAPAERVSVTEALTAYTYGSAFAVSREAEVGRITPGRLADFVVLSEDILTVDPAGIKDLHVTATVIGGEVVFERGEDSA